MVWALNLNTMYYQSLIYFCTIFWKCSGKGNISVGIFSLLYDLKAFIYIIIAKIELMLYLAFSIGSPELCCGKYLKVATCFQCDFYKKYHLCQRTCCSTSLIKKIKADTVRMLGSTAWVFITPWSHLPCSATDFSLSVFPRQLLSEHRIWGFLILSSKLCTGGICTEFICSIEC